MRRLRVGDRRLHTIDVVLDVAVGHEDVQPAVQVEVEEEAAEGEGQEARLSDAGHRRVVDEQAASLVVVQGEHLVGEVADHQAVAPAAVIVGGVDAHGAPRLSLLAEGDAGRLADLLERTVVPVVVKEIRLRVVGDRQVGPAVSVVVEGDDAQRLAGRVEDARPARHVFEGAVTPVAEQPIGGAAVRLGGAIRLADTVESAEDVVLRGPLHVVAGEKIQPAVPVVIDPGGAGPEAGVGDPRLLRHVLERPVPFVAEEAVGTQGVDEQVDVAVVVVVGGRDSDAVHLHRQPGLPGGVLECPVAPVAVERLRRFPPALLRPVGALDEEKVLVAVAVVIQKRHARAHRFRQVFPSEGAAVVAERNTGRAGHVGEEHRVCGSRLGGGRGRRRVAPAAATQERERGERQGGLDVPHRPAGLPLLATAPGPAGRREASLASGTKRFGCSWMGWRSRFISAFRRRYGPVIDCAASSALKRV